MPINWGLAQQPNALAMMMQGFEQGREMKREQGVRNALGTLIQNPNDQGAFGALAQGSPEMALQFRGQQQTQQQQQAKQQQEQLIQMGRLLDNARDEPTYQQSLAAAKQIGIDTTRAPANFDPNWVEQQRTVLSAFEKDGGQAISAAGQKAIDLGYERGSPEFVQVVRQILEAEQSKPYVVGGETRLYRPSLAPQTAPQAVPQQPAKVTSFEAATQAAQQMGAQFPEFVRNNGFRVSVASPEQAMQLPSGTPLILPDGTEGVVP